MCLYKEITFVFSYIPGNVLQHVAFYKEVIQPFYWTCFSKYGKRLSLYIPNNNSSVCEKFHYLKTDTMIDVFFPQVTFKKGEGCLKHADIFGGFDLDNTYTVLKKDIDYPKHDHLSAM